MVVGGGVSLWRWKGMLADVGRWRLDGESMRGKVYVSLLETN